MSASIRSSGSYTAANVDQTIASITAGDTFVFMGAVSDGDPVHRGIDSAPTIGGVSMVAAPGLISAGGQNNQVDIYILKNCAGGTNVTLHTSYHAAPTAFMGSWFVVQSADTTTQPQGTPQSSTTSTAGTSASVSYTSLSAGDLLLEVIAAGNTPAVGSSQTSDFTGSGNASSFASGHKTAAAGTNAESWTFTSAAYAYAVVAVKASGAAPTVKSYLGFF
jgi:hypothetical protein